MKKLIVIVLFMGVFTQSVFAEYMDSALYLHCEHGIINGKYRGGAYNPKVCIRAIKAVINDKSISKLSNRYSHAHKIAQKVCRKYQTSNGRKACQLEKYYWKKYLKTRTHNGLGGW